MTYLGGGVFAYDILYAELRNYLHAGGRLSSEENRLLLDLIVSFVRFFRDAGFDVISRVGREGHEALSVNEVFEWENCLYSRYGIVELRAIFTWMSEDEKIKAIKEIEACHADSSFMYESPKTKGNWLSADDHCFNIRRLMTNAGLYFGDSLKGEFSSWARKYVEALKSSGCFFVVPNAYPNFFIMDSRLGEYILDTPYVKFPAPQKFFDSIAGKRVLFLTPFSDQINSLYESGDIFNLYKDLVVPEFAIKALPGFLTTYPNSPHSGWTETFEKMCMQVDEELKANRVDIFFASCGCYGLPLCHYVHEKHNIPSVYHGNLLNTYFGIRMKSNETFMQGRKNESVWKKSYLSNVENVAAIDGGRYT